MKKIISLITLFMMTISAVAQTGYFYEWKNGSYTRRSISEIDSITFVLHEDSMDIPEYAVDLGLPSGTLWADRNVGADAPEDYGDYFAWGETLSKNTYDWTTYKWSDGAYNTMTKYCTYSTYGKVDGKMHLDAEDDAATVNMGRPWRMPTYEELKELCDKCTWTWSEQNKIKGYVVTGPNGNKIFLPAAGVYQLFDKQPANIGMYGVYWSSTLNKDEPCFAANLDTYTDNYYVGKSVYRFSGLSVRAVVR